MNYLQEIRTLLLEIQRSYAQDRFILIGQLQEMIWGENNLQNEELSSLLSELAGDLNFYEPVEKDRDESLGYYGDEKFDQLLVDVIKKIDEFATP